MVYRRQALKRILDVAADRFMEIVGYAAGRTLRRLAVPGTPPRPKWTLGSL
jgi:hypothetical protein